MIAAATGGTIPTLSKLLLVNDGPIQISALVFLFSGVALIPYQPKVVPRRGNVLFILAIATVGAAVAPVLYQFGLNQTTAVNASLLTNGEVFFTAVIAFSFFHESLGRRQLAEGLLIVAGIIVVSTNLELANVKFLQGLAGNALILAATLCWAIENNLSRIGSQRFGAVFVTKYRNIFGGLIVILLMVAFAVPITVAVSSLPDLVLLTAAMAATSLLSIAALRKIGAVRTLLAFSTTSIFGSAFALVFLGEPITPVQLAGGGLILFGVYLIQRSERSPSWTGPRKT